MKRLDEMTIEELKVVFGVSTKHNLEAPSSLVPDTSEIAAPNFLEKQVGRTILVTDPPKLGRSRRHRLKDTIDCSGNTDIKKTLALLIRNYCLRPTVRYPVFLKDIGEKRYIVMRGEDEVFITTPQIHWHLDRKLHNIGNIYFLKFLQWLIFAVVENRGHPIRVEGGFEGLKNLAFPHEGKALGSKLRDMFDIAVGCKFLWPSTGLLDSLCSSVMHRHPNGKNCALLQVTPSDSLIYSLRGPNNSIIAAFYEYPQVEGRSNDHAILIYVYLRLFQEIYVRKSPQAVEHIIERISWDSGISENLCRRWLGSWQEKGLLTFSKKQRVSFVLDSKVIESARNAVVHSYQDLLPLTLNAVANNGIRGEVRRLQDVLNNGEEFPQRTTPLRRVGPYRKTSDTVKGE